MVKPPIDVLGVCHKKAAGDGQLVCWNGLNRKSLVVAVVYDAKQGMHVLVVVLDAGIADFGGVEVKIGVDVFAPSGEIVGMNVIEPVAKIADVAPAVQFGVIKQFSLDGFFYKMDFLGPKHV